MAFFRLYAWVYWHGLLANGKAADSHKSRTEKRTASPQTWFFCFPQRLRWPFTYPAAELAQHSPRRIRCSANTLEVSRVRALPPQRRNFAVWFSIGNDLVTAQIIRGRATVRHSPKRPTRDVGMTQIRTNDFYCLTDVTSTLYRGQPESIIP